MVAMSARNANVILTTLCCLISVLFPKWIWANSVDLRNKRYCEVILSKGRHLEVYNTIGLNDCPEALWKNLTVQDIKKDTGAFYVYLNGPRCFIVDGIKNTALLDPEIKIFNQLNMRKAGILEMSLRDIVIGESAYRKHYVKRHTTWVYESGKRIYELIDPKGEVYVMQSYIISPTQQSEKDLMQLNKNIQLEKGWQYKTGILKQTQDLKAEDDEAIVIRDNVGNTYQKANQDFL